jgi:hypothetical protein
VLTEHINSNGRIEADRMRTALFVALAAVWVSAGSPAVAEDLDGEAIRDLVAGKTVYLRNYGLELPLRYRADGVVSGDISGLSIARMFAPKEQGRWWVDGQRLCQQWTSWYDGKVLCFTIRKTGERSISWTRQDGFSGKARIEG